MYRHIFLLQVDFLKIRRVLYKTFIAFDKQVIYQSLKVFPK